MGDGPHYPVGLMLWDGWDLCFGNSSPELLQAVGGLVRVGVGVWKASCSSSRAALPRQGAWPY